MAQTTPHSPLILFFLLLTTIPNAAQEIVFVAPEFSKTMAAIELERKGNEAVRDELNYDWTIYFKKFENVLALDFVSGREIFSMFNSSNFEDPTYQRFKKEHTSYANFLGSYGTAENRSFVYTKNSHKKFLVINHDRATKNTTESILDFKLNDGIFLGHFTYESEFYIIAWEKLTRVFKLYVLGQNNTFQTFSIDLEKGKFFKDGTPSPFPKKMRSRDPLINMGKVYYDKSERVLTEIKSSIPNANRDVTERNKFFVYNNKLKITLDYDKKYTTLIAIDLKSLESNTHQISKKINSDSDPFNQKSNSYLFENLLFQIKGDNKNVSLHLFDLNANNHYPIHDFNRKSPYLKEKNLLLSKEIILKFNLDFDVENKEDVIHKRLRKIMKSGNQIGLQITENEDTFLVAVGGYLEREDASPFFMFGAIGGAAYAIAYPYGSYGGFIRDESLDLLIDKKTLALTFGEFVNPYQRMEDFLNETYEAKADKRIKWLTKFKIDSDYYLGYLDKKTKEYIIRKFN